MKAKLFVLLAFVLFSAITIAQERIKSYSNTWWEWDGRILKPYWEGYNDAWEFDGRIFKPYWGGYNDAWEWDGRIFKPYWGGYNDAWEWDGRIFNPYWGGYNDAWEWDGRIFKPYWSYAWENEEGIPFIAKAAVILYDKNKPNVIDSPTLNSDDIMVYFLQDELVVESSVDIQSVAMFTMNGKMLERTTQTRINVSALSTGAYIIQIQTQQGIIVKKVIKK